MKTTPTNQWTYSYDSDFWYEDLYPADLGYEEKNCGAMDCDCLKCWSHTLEE